MPLSPPFDAPAQQSPLSALSPPYEELALAAPAQGQGPPVQIITLALPGFGQGPPVQHTTFAPPNFGQGPPVQTITTSLPGVGQGAPVQHDTLTLKAFGQGAPTQIITIGAVVFAQGAPVQHDTQALPSFAQGPPVQHTTDAPAVVTVPPAAVIEDDCAPEFITAPAPNFRQVNFGDPEPQEPEDSLNKLTPLQYRFIQRRNAGGDNAPVFGRFTGPAYPFGARWADTLGPKPDLNVVFTSVVNILTTPLGSLPYATNMGSPVPLLVFEINDATTQGLIKRFTQDNLRDQEPRARVLFVRTVVPEDDPNRVVVTVAFQIVGDPSARVYTAPIQFNTLSLAL